MKKIIDNIHCLSITDEHFIKCQCGAEVLAVSFNLDKLKDERGNICKTDLEIYLAMFTYGNYSNKLPFKHRLRRCWHLLKTGEYFLDEVILSKNDAIELANKINEFVKEDNEKSI